MTYHKDKKCKRKKCPYYDSISQKCMKCEWNPDSVWAVRKEKKYV